MPTVVAPSRQNSTDGRPPQQGIDVVLLVKRDGAWRIVSIVNELLRPGVAVPDELRK